MKTRSVLILLGVAVFVFAGQTEASARGRRTQPRNGPVAKAIRIAIPSPADIRAVPVPNSGQLATYPVDVVKYGLNLHPGARVARAAVNAAVNR
jgi:hypothetical protein